MTDASHGRRAGGDGMDEKGESQLFIVDAHVHFHSCFAVEDFLASAARNFAHAGAGLGLDWGVGGKERGCCVLMLTESAGVDWFASLSALAASNGHGHTASEGTWRFSKTSEPQSLLASGPDSRQLLIIGGRQVVTAEGLEVLWLGTTEQPPDGRTAADSIRGALEAGAVPVLPWGFGKWTGRRGRILQSLILESSLGGEFHLGDNSGRPGFWPAPRWFGEAQRRGRRVLPGTDPLPFAEEVSRPGGYGFYGHGELGTQTPFRQLKALIDDPTVILNSYGRLEQPVRFARNQITMQLRNVGPRGG